MPDQDANSEDLKYWVAFHRISGLGPIRMSRLEARFGNLRDAWIASSRDVQEAAALDGKSARAVQSQRQKIDPDEEMERLAREGVRPVHLRSPEYPSLLLETEGAPSVIYVRGELVPDDDRSVAVIGARNATPYGAEMARRLAYDLAEAGVTVLSGLARGIDGIAHRAALDAGGRTIAVMGGGLDGVYPVEHTSLAASVAESGAIISEYPLGMLPQPQHFPRRNRVISGLSRAVLVVEASMKSGALLTVKWALEQDRDVFAVPGNVLSENSAGTNWLIQQGARLVTTSEDVLEELNIAVQIHAPDPAEPHRKQSDKSAENDGLAGLDNLAREDNGISGVESRVVEFLNETGGPAHVDEVTRAVGEPAPVISSAIAVLELKGIVRQVGPMQFVADPNRRAQKVRSGI